MHSKGAFLHLTYVIVYREVQKCHQLSPYLTYNLLVSQYKRYIYLPSYSVYYLKLDSTILRKCLIKLYLYNYFNYLNCPLYAMIQQNPHI